MSDAQRAIDLLKAAASRQKEQRDAIKATSQSIAEGREIDREALKGTKEAQT